MVDKINVRIVDGDLGAKVSDMGATDFVVPSTYRIKDAVAKIRALAGPNPIGRLTVICHGVGMLAHGDVNPGTGERLSLPNNSNKFVCRIYGGYGLDLGKDRLSLTNVMDFLPLKEKFDPGGVIIIYGCAAADTGPTHTIPLNDEYASLGMTFTGDGPALMKKLAAVTGVSVVAATELQTVMQNSLLRTADRMPFVGPTYRFTPDGSQTLNAASY